MSYDAHTLLNGANDAAAKRLQQTVEQFFSQINWEDQPPEIRQLRQLAAESQSVSSFITVSQFFGAIRWERNSASSAPLFDLPDGSLSKSSLDAAQSFTLDRFSDLF
jgi:hypothetical protein